MSTKMHEGRKDIFDMMNRVVSESELRQKTASHPVYHVRLFQDFVLFVLFVVKDFSEKSVLPVG